MVIRRSDAKSNFVFNCRSVPAKEELQTGVPIEKQGGLCSLIEKFGVAEISLVVANAALLYCGHQESQLPPYRLRGSSMSLKALLEGLRPQVMSGQQKLALQLEIAKAFWQLYASSWMRRTWTNEVVHFVFQRQKETPSHQEIRVDDPLLQVQFDSATMEQLEIGQQPYFPWPAVHSLGVILLEIELGDCINRTVEDLGYLDPETGWPKPHAEFKAAEILIEYEKLLEESVNPGACSNVAHIIKSCLRITSDLNQLHDRGIIEQRHAIFKLIVSPLETLLNKKFRGREVIGLLIGEWVSNLRTVQQITNTRLNESQPCPILVRVHCI